MKKIISGVTALSVILGLTACGGGTSETTEATTAEVTTTTGVEINTAVLDEESKEKLSSAADMVSGELENKTIKWMSNWDINPDSSGKSTPLALEIFHDKFDGVVEYYPVTWESRYTDLATYVLGGEGIDFYPISNLDNYPNGAVNSLFQPIDDYVDFSSPLWSGVKAVNEQYDFNGSHYTIITSVTSGDVVIYSRKTIEDNGLDDPADLFAEGKWDWDAYKRLLSEYVDVESNQDGIDGWYIATPLYCTTGVPLISLRDGQLVSNLDTPELERAMNYEYDLYKNGYILDKSIYGWTTQETKIGTGEELYYPCGLWTLWRAKELWQPVFGDDVMFVPQPRDPDADKYYLPATLEGFMMCKGAQNPEGVIKYAECCLAASTDPATEELSDNQLRNDYGWTDEMIEMMKTANGLSAENPVIDLYPGASTDINSLLVNAAAAATTGTDWATTRDTYKDTVNVLVKEVNDAMKKSS